MTGVFGKQDLEAAVALRIPWGNHGSGASCPPAGVAVAPLAGASRCATVHAARHRSIRAWRER
jgi:hypothetical protein